MKIKITIIFMAVSFLGSMFCDTPTGASGSGSGTVNVENVENLNMGDGTDGGTHGCPKDVQKDYGLFEYRGHKGPLCKPAIATKISEKKCASKGLTNTQNLCVMEWVSKGGYFRVRVLK